jgi:hypothetical protein
MSLAIAAIFAVVGFILLPGILMFILFTPMGWSITAFSVFALLIFTIYKIYSM